MTSKTQEIMIEREKAYITSKNDKLSHKMAIRSEMNKTFLNIFWKYTLGLTSLNPLAIATKILINIKKGRAIEKIFRTEERRGL